MRAQKKFSLGRSILNNIFGAIGRFLVPGCVFVLGGCADGARNLASLALSSTGYVSQNEADALIGAGETLQKSSQSLTAENEYFLGRSVSAHILGMYPPLRGQPRIQGYLNAVGLVLAQYSDKPDLFKGYHFAVLDSDEVNALSTPGGFVFVSRGFLQLLTDEDMLAAVLAHEIGHIVLGHGTKAISQSNMSKALLNLGKEVAISQGGYGVSEVTSIFGDSVTDVVDTLITKGYSRSQEYEADQYAYDLLQRAHFDPLALIEVLEKLHGISINGGWFSTHPDAEDRVDNLKERNNVPQAALPDRIVRLSRFKLNTKTLS